MRNDDHIRSHRDSPPPVPFAKTRRGWTGTHRIPRPRRPRMKKLRLLLILAGLGTLAGVSTLFGMMMAIASDLPQLEQIDKSGSKIKSSVLYDDQNRLIGILQAPDKPKVLDTFAEIAPNMRQAIVSVEDRRFWTESGVDLRSLGRAALSDLTGGPKEGASTIPEQFVKQSLREADNRTVFEKLREAVLAYHLTREWPKTKILKEYLNLIYFGHGAYGVESAARIYFGKQLGFNNDATKTTGTGACGDPNQADPKIPECASKLRSWQSALLAGMVANPTAFDPLEHPQAAKGRRNLVLSDMYEQHYLSRAQYEHAKAQPLPTSTDIQAPLQPAAAPFFTSWLDPQIIAALEREGISPKLAYYRAYYGGLKIRTTIDLKLQAAAQSAVNEEFGSNPHGPTAALVAIDNKTGQVRAMVSGSESYTTDPFNLATQGHRQPGSSFKVFTLATALSGGTYGPDSVFPSEPERFLVANSAGKEFFTPHNFGDHYNGPITLTEATAISDNTVFARLGLDVGTKNIARMAHNMGIRSPISTNDSMTLGGLKVGVSVLDMAHAYETVAEGGVKVYDPRLGDLDVPGRPGPTGIQSITCGSVCPEHYIGPRPVYKRVFPATTAAEIHQMLEGVVSAHGTAPNAAIPGVDVVGKTGTTSDYVDAWFVGWTPKLTTAVWVGYPNGAVSMTTNYAGEPVEGGTYPAIIWRDFMEQALQIVADETPAAKDKSTSTDTTTDSGTTYTGTGTAPSVTTTGTATGTGTGTTGAPPSDTTTAAGGTATTGGAATEPAAAGTPTTAAPAPTPTAPAPTQTPTTAPTQTTGGGGTATSGGAGLGSGGG